LGVDHWVRANFSKPSPETLRNLLAASAGGTATILGLVVSISLIAWQTTAERYRSSSIVAFLLREGMGSAVVRLLAVALAYSLWLLALLEVFHFRPYGSAAFAVVLSTLAVLSLLSYRQLGLLVDVYCRAAAKIDLADAWFAAHGYVGEDGKLPAVALHYSTLLNVQAERSSGSRLTCAIGRRRTRSPSTGSSTGNELGNRPHPAQCSFGRVETRRRRRLFRPRSDSPCRWSLGRGGA